MAFPTLRRLRRGHRPAPAADVDTPSTGPQRPTTAAPADGEPGGAGTTYDLDALLDEADRVAAADGPVAAIELLRAANRDRRDPVVDARVLLLRHRAFEGLAEPGRDVWPVQIDDRFAGVDGCPEVTVAELDADLLASAVTHHGCLLVRGLVDAEGTARLVETIDESFRACDERAARSEPPAAPGPWYHPFSPGGGYPEPAKGHRGWVRAAGGVLAADSPPAFETMTEAFERAGLREVISAYLGEHPVFAVDKVTLRRVPLDLGGAEWHQDGSFLGDGIRTLNVWLALSDCGGDEPSPGLDLVPKRFDAVLPTGTDGAFFDWSVGPGVVERESQDAPVIRPRFGAGDALLFDDLFLHRTAIEPSMNRERYAIESWFFAASRYPGTAIPIVF